LFLVCLADSVCGRWGAAPCAARFRAMGEAGSKFQPGDRLHRHTRFLSHLVAGCIVLAKFAVRPILSPASNEWS